jgi:hypothetical protein
VLRVNLFVQRSLRAFDTVPFCDLVGVQRIADTYDVDATPVDVSNAYAKDVAPSNSRRHRAIRLGCYVGLER